MMTFFIMAMEGLSMNRELQGPKSPYSCPRLRGHREDTGPLSQGLLWGSIGTSAPWVMVMAPKDQILASLDPCETGKVPSWVAHWLPNNLSFKEGPLDLLRRLSRILCYSSSFPRARPPPSFPPLSLPPELFPLLSCSDPSRKGSKASRSSW